MPQPVLLHQVRVFDPSGPYHGQQVDLLIQRGTVSINPESLPSRVKTISYPDLEISHGWADIGAVMCEPGHEHRETVRSLQDAALAGGFAHVLVKPETDPIVDNRGAVVALQALAADHPVELQFIGSIGSAGHNGRLAEMGELVDAGVRHFTHAGDSPLSDPKLLQLALAYSGQLDATVMIHPGQERLNGDGQMNEGTMSTRLGLPGIPAYTELVGVTRDLEVFKYQGGSLHVSAISTGEVLQLLTKRAAGHVTFGIPVMNLLLTDESLQQYDVNLKVLPPFRSATDRRKLISAIKKGEATVLVSQHRPAALEDKQVEFPYASFGAATIELAYSIARTAVEDSNAVVEYFGAKNRSFLGLDSPPIQTGARTSLTVYRKDVAYTPSRASAKTLGYNVPLTQRQLLGRPVGIFTDGAFHFSPHES